MHVYIYTYAYAYICISYSRLLNFFVDFRRYLVKIFGTLAVLYLNLFIVVCPNKKNLLAYLWT